MRKLTPESAPPFFFLPPSSDSIERRFSSSIETLFAASHDACEERLRLLCDYCETTLWFDNSTCSMIARDIFSFHPLSTDICIWLQ